MANLDSAESTAFFIQAAGLVEKEKSGKNPAEMISRAVPHSPKRQKSENSEPAFTKWPIQPDRENRVNKQGIRFLPPQNHSEFDGHGPGLKEENTRDHSSEFDISELKEEDMKQWPRDHSSEFNISELKEEDMKQWSRDHSSEFDISELKEEDMKQWSRTPNDPKPLIPFRDSRHTGYPLVHGSFYPQASHHPVLSQTPAPAMMPLTEDALRIAQSKIKWVDFKWARDNVTLPELEAHGVPRRNHKFKGSFPSLPSVPLMKISDDTIGSHGAEVPKRNNQSDIRGQIGLEHNIAINDGKWLKYNWDHPDGKDDNDLFASETYLNKFVLTWHQNVLGNVRAKLLIRNEPEHWKCDIDTDTGFLAPPIAYPDTIVDLSTQIPELRWRRHNFTSALIVRNYEIDHERRTRRGGRRADIAPIEYESIDPEDAVRLGLVVKQPEVEIPVKNPITPRAKCYLRPAQKADMEAVARIYNWEVKNGLQALDSEPLAIEDFKKIFKTTQELGMPFLVAVSGSVGDLHLNDRTATYSPYRQILPNNRARPKKNSKVLGFSYLSVWEPGLAGGGTGASRATAKIHVFVDHASRMKKIGFSLLDKLISSVSGRYSSESSYDFVDPSANPIYKHPIRNHDRKYYQVYLNYFVKHKHRDQGLEQEQKSYDDDLKWVKSLLEEKLNFSEKVRFEATHRTAKARSGPVYWLDSVVFEHTCQFDPRFEEGF